MREESVGEDSAGSSQCPGNDDTEVEEQEVTQVASTKQPTRPQKRLTKRQRVEEAETQLIKKAITCIDKVKDANVSTEDGNDLFGRYVTTELKALPSPQAQRWAKLQIQNILYSVQADVTPQPQPPFYQTFRDAPMGVFPVSFPVQQSDGMPTSSFARTPSLSPTSTHTNYSLSAPSPQSNPEQNTSDMYQ